VNEVTQSRLSPATMRRLLSRLVLVVLVPLLLAQIGIYVAWYRNRWSEAEEANLRTARAAATIFQGNIEDVRRQEWAIGQTLIDSPLLDANTREYPAVRAWHWVAKDGKITASSDRREIGRDVSDVDYFRELSGGRSWTMSGLLTDPTTKDRVFIVARRIDDKRGRLAGIVAATIAPDIFNAELADLRHHGEGAVTLFDADGTLIYSSDEDKEVGKNHRADDPLLTATLDLCTEHQGTFKSPDNGKPFMAARVPIGKLGWVAGASHPVRTAIADVYRGLWIVAGLNLLVAIGSVVFAARTGSTLIAQLRCLQSHAQAIGRGDFAHVAVTQSVSELNELASAFNHMGAAVWAAQEALESTNAALEDRVRQRTAELAASIEKIEQSERELRAASLYARGLLEASLDPFVTISPDGKITDVNEATEAATGVPRSRLVGTDFSAYFTEPELARNGYRRALAEGFVRDYPLTIRHVSGRTIDVLYNAVVYRNEAGESQGVFAAARDVTEQRRVEAELTEYREHLEELVKQRTTQLEAVNAQLEAVFNVVNVGMLLVSDVGVVKRINNTLSRWVGKHLPAIGDCQPGDIIGCVHAILAPDGCGTTEHCRGCPIRNAFESVLRSGQPVHDIETEAVVSIDGRERRLWLEVSADPVVLEGRRNAILAMSNITARKQAERAAERLASFPMLNPNPVAEVDLEGNVQYMNPTTERWFPDLREKGASHPWLADWDAIVRALRNGESLVSTREVMVGDKCYEQTIHYVADIERIRLYGIEITDRKRAEEALRLAADQLKESNEELEQFAYVASHDLQEPLRVVTGYVQLIERKYKDQLDDDAKQFMFYVVDGVSRMQQLITDLLNYSRVGSRNEPFREVDMRLVVDRALANLKTVIDETGAVVTCDALPPVHGDEAQLVQLFQNLIGNGIKFHGDRTPGIHIFADRRGNAWEFAVRDNGIGIEKRYWEQIFEIFQRLHKRQEYAGTGIGLAICKRIVERHGGRIRLESEPGQGTTFFFVLS
jgi:PAS domain S-box-containing protein